MNVWKSFASVFGVKMKWISPKILVTVGLLLFFLMNSFNEESPDEVFPSEARPTKSGYLTIKEKKGAFMFYAYYEAISPAENLRGIPILLWLEGGQGCSSMAGNFYETGPWTVGDDLRLHRNSASWNRLFGLLFVDSPIGSGFSTASTNKLIPVDEEEVARDLYSALQDFFDLNPLFRSRPLYVVGQSYAGKYVPSLAYYMVRMLDEGEPGALRVDGVAIGDGWVHPVVQIQWFASAAYAQGLIDSRQKLQLEKLQQEAVSLTRRQKWNDASTARKRVFRFLESASGLATILDVRRTVPYYVSENGTDYLPIFLNRRDVKEALRANVNVTWKQCNDAVAKRMVEDAMKSSKWMVEWLVGRMPILLYQGQFDLGSAVSTEEWMQTLDWSGLSDFWDSERKVWRVSNVFAGYVRSHSNLTHVVVARAGHLAPFDQKVYCQMMIESWVLKNPLNPLYFQA